VRRDFTAGRAETTFISSQLLEALAHNPSTRRIFQLRRAGLERRLPGLALVARYIRG